MQVRALSRMSESQAGKAVTCGNVEAERGTPHAAWNALFRFML